ncbi:hypothetical protein ACWPM1_07640 [Tsuneonella sp. HG249]
MSELLESVLSAFDADRLAKPPTRKEFYRFTVDTIEDLAVSLSAEIKALRERIDELEKGGARFRGIYQRASAYRRGDQATHKGSLWIALGDVPEGTMPGENPASWQLSAKGAA